MAALRDEGRSPAVQKISRSQFEKLQQRAQQDGKPTPQLVQALISAKVK